MTTVRLDEQFLWGRSPLQSELRRLMGVLETRIQPLENEIVDWEAQVEELQAVGLQRIDEVLGPLLTLLNEAANLGFLVVQAAQENVSLSLGLTTSWQCTSDGFELFTPTPYLLAVDDNDETNWGIVQLLQWVKETGELSGICMYASKTQLSDSWTISCNSGVWPLMMQAVSDATDAKTAAEAAVSVINDSMGVLEDLIEAVQEGPVASVAGRTGAVILSLDDITGLVAALAEKASTTTLNSGLSSKQDSSAKLTALAGLTLVADQLIYATGAATLGASTLSSYMRGVLAATDAAAARTALGVTATAPASDADIRSATGSGYIPASSIESASAFVTLTDAATIALDWDTGINFEVTLTANRILDNPTNGQPGTTRTVLLKGSSTTDRSLTYGDQYKGGLPTMTDIDNGRWYMLTIFCITSTHFAVAAQKVLG